MSVRANSGHLGVKYVTPSFDDVGLVSSLGALECTETGRRTQMAKLVDVWIFDWDKYSPDDLVQKDDSFQLGPVLCRPS